MRVVVWLIAAIQQTQQQDVALLFGSDLPILEFYQDTTCSNGADIIDLIDVYPGRFSGPVSGIYLPNIGVVVCGGKHTPDCTDPTKLCPTGCYWLKADTTTDPEQMRHTWQSIRYVEDTGQIGSEYGMAVAPITVNESSGLWITGGYFEKPDDPTTSTYFWGEGTEFFQPHTETEPFGRSNHCLVRVNVHDHEFYLEIGGYVNGAYNQTAVTIYRCLTNSCENMESEVQYPMNPTNLEIESLDKPTCTAYLPPSSTNDEVLVLAINGASYKIKCYTWLPSNMSCTWIIEKTADLPPKLDGESVILPYTDEASLVNMEGVPHAFGVYTEGAHYEGVQNAEVWMFVETEWLQKDPMFGGERGRSNLEVVSVPLEYLCFGYPTTTETPSMPTTPGSNLTPKEVTTPFNPFLHSLSRSMRQRRQL